MLSIYNELRMTSDISFDEYCKLYINMMMETTIPFIDTAYLYTIDKVKDDLDFKDKYKIFYKYYTYDKTTLFPKETYKINYI